MQLPAPCGPVFDLRLGWRRSQYCLQDGRSFVNEIRKMDAIISSMHSSGIDPERVAEIIQQEYSPDEHPSFNSLEPRGYRKSQPRKTLPKRKGRQKNSGGPPTLRWIPKARSVRLAGRSLGGMIYVGPSSSVMHPVVNVSAINPKLRIAARGLDFSKRGMSDPPNYEIASPASRVTYLDWLARGRSEKRCSIEYPLLYFSGLEYRLMVERTTSHERRQIVTEARRLLAVYGANPALGRPVKRFLAAVDYLFNASDIRPVFKPGKGKIPTPVLVGLGLQIARTQSLTADWLLSWLMCTSYKALRVPARRAFPEFKASFRVEFDRLFPLGMEVDVPHEEVRLTYQSPSRRFYVDIADVLGGIPDVSFDRKPPVIALELAHRSCKAIDKYSRYIGKRPQSRGKIEAHVYLPKELWSKISCSNRSELRNWTQQRVRAGGLTPFTDVITALQGHVPDKLRKLQIDNVSDVLAHFNVGMAPDPRHGGPKPKTGESVVLFKLAGNRADPKASTESFRYAFLGLIVGTMVAHAEGQNAGAKRTHLARQIGTNKTLNVAQRKILRAYLDLWSTSPPKLGLMRSELRKSRIDIRRTLGWVAIFTAQAGGDVSRAEIRVLEKLYTTLGLGSENVYNDLLRISSGPGPVTVRPARKGDRDVALPAPQIETNTTFTLDSERVAAIIADTANASHILGEIFEDENAEQPDTPGLESEGEGMLSGLDNSHRAIAIKLASRPEWTESEVSELASQYQLMVSGALETINEWAFERYGDLLVEEYDGYETNDDVAQQLTSIELEK